MSKLLHEGNEDSKASLYIFGIVHTNPCGNDGPGIGMFTVLTIGHLVVLKASNQCK